MSSVVTDAKAVDWFLDHARESIYPSREALRERLMSGRPMKVYNGIDPTGPTLHLGHTIPLRKLAELQRLGHKVILLIGDFTAMIGDPTDKSATRKQLTREEVLTNCRLYQQQAAQILDFDGPNAAEFRFNSEWLAKLSLTDVVELAACFTVQQMLERDMFEKRVAEGKPVHVHEFLYPLMQGYDSVAMDVDLEIGGNDQTFNMLAGRTLMKTRQGKDKLVLTTRLLSDATGKKMGKTEGNMLSFLDVPEDMYGKVMSWTDEMIVPGFEICTSESKDTVRWIKSEILAGKNPKDFKMQLARIIVCDLLGEAAATKALEHFSRVHITRRKPQEMPELLVTTDTPLVDVLVQSGLVDSKMEARRQIEQGAVKVNDKIVMDVKAVIEPTKQGVVIQKGKRFFVRVLL